mmetsp:Transcript_7107/g.9741  ORF Transcript_7107/g.9741 Transcript_7107/m.9741 type:complete len:114 (-) Transcript_7107:301-642(-)
MWRDPLTLLDDMREMQLLQDGLVKGNLSSFMKLRNETLENASSDFIMRELKKTRKRGKVETQESSCSTRSIQHEKEEQVDRTVLDNLFKSRDGSKDASTSLVLIEDLGEAPPK